MTHLLTCKYLFAFIVIYSICTSKTNAQILTYKTIQADNELISNEIYTVIQDSKGYIWMGTKNGLCRWDSKNFKYFTISDGLPNNEVLYLYEDYTGKIWISCFSEQACYFFNNRIHNKENTPFLKKIKIYQGTQFIEHNNEFYYISPDAHVNSINLTTEKKKIYNTTLTQFRYIIYNNSVYGVEDSRRRESLINKDARNLVFSIDTSYYTRYYFYPNSPNNNLLTRMDFQKKQYSFQYGFDAPFYQANYTNKDIQFCLYNNGKILEIYKTHVLQKRDNYTIKADFSNPQLFAIKNNLIATVTNGLFFCRQIPILEYEQNNIINNNAKFIFKHENQIHIVNSKYELIDVLRQKKINRLNKRAVNLYNLLNFEQKTYITTSFYIYSFSDPHELIKTYPENTVCNFKYINASKKKDYFFIANGVRHAIFLINFKTGIRDTLLNDVTKVVYSVFEDKKSRFWYSTTNKVFYTNEYYNGVKNSKEFVLDPASPLFCKSIQEDNKGNLFFTTNGGVFVYDGKKKYRIDQTNLLSDNECNKVVIDTAHNSFWVATKNGVNHISYKKDSNGLKFKVWSKFFASDGLRSNNINDLLLDSNKLYIATDKGVNILAEPNYRPDTQHIPIFVRLNLVNAIAKKAYDTLNSIELKHNQNNLTIGFSALYFLRRDRLKTKAYLYRNNDLISQSEITEDKIDYYSLNDGQYKLVIYAFDQDYRYINGKSLPFVFIINPPYYKTWWFIVGTSLLIIIITVSIALWNINRRKKRALQQAELQAKLNESTLKSLQSQMNPHFVFNSLNTIQSFITEKNEEGAIDYLADFSSLMREILEQSVHTFISLENEIHFLQQYIKLELTRYKDSFDVSWNINLEEEDLTDIYIPTMLIQPILENAVKHGVSNLINVKGHIDVTLELAHENLLKITIKDNGTPSTKGSFKGNSIAVQTIKDRLSIYTKNKVKGVYALEVQETGATATITIPI